MINNRQNGRRRGRGGQQRSQGGGNQGSRDNGNRIDSRARGNASQLLEKYKNLAADAQRQGDRVNTEYYLQFADHYFRVLADQRGRFEDQGQQQRRPQNDFDADEDYGDEGEPIRAEEQGRGGEDRAERQNDGNRQYEGRQHDGNRGRSDRDDEPRYEGQREPRRFDGGDARGGEGRGRDGQERRPRQGGTRGAPRREDRAEVESSTEQLVPEVVQGEVMMPASQAEPTAETQAEAPVAKRRGRPRKALVEGGAGAGEEQLGFDASTLPPSIGSEAPAGDAAPKPRRRRAAAVPADVDA